MYPAILAREHFPVRHYSYRYDPPAREPQELAHSFGVIARVTIETDTPEYPVRRGGDIHYPVGRFQTTLTGPELLALRKDGKVLKCHAMMLYEMGRPFKQAAECMLAAREEAKKYGDGAWEAFSKLVANALAGKLAQRKGEWQERRRKAPAQSWGEWTESTGKSGLVRRYRAVAGLVWEYIRDKHGAGPCTFAFAYLTAYGRLQMRRIREKCPPETVISQDTDGIWVTTAGGIALKDAGLLAKTGPGFLRFTEQAEAARFFAPRHYWTPQLWRLAGFSHGEYNPFTQEVLSSVKLNPLHWSAIARPTATFLRTNAKKLSPVLRSAELDQWGWAHAKTIG
jgi:DNA polymerase type B, organellar and viral